MQALRKAKATCRNVARSLKPVDVIVVGYLLLTWPLMFIADDFDNIAWSGILCRILVVPAVVATRYYLANTDPLDLPSARHIATVVGCKLVFSWAQLLLLALDMYPLLVCIYLYAEDGVLIANLYPTNGFYDSQLHLMDAVLFSTPVDTGLSAYLRSLSPEIFNKVCLVLCSPSFHAAVVLCMYSTKTAN